MKIEIAKMKLIYLPIVVACIFISAACLKGDVNFENKLSVFLNAGARQPALNPSTQPWVISPAFSLGAGAGVNERIMLVGEYEFGKVYNDILSTSTFKIGRENADRYWQINTIKAKIKYYFISKSNFVPYMTSGIGICFWSIKHYSSDEPIQVPDSDGIPGDYSANEFLLNGGFGFEWFVRENISISADASFNYLTGIGADFADSVQDFRSKAYGDIKFGFSLYFTMQKGDISITEY